MTDLCVFYLQLQAWPSCPLFVPFALSRRLIILPRLLGIPLLSHPSRSSPARSFLRSHSASLSFAPSLAPTSVALKNPSSGVAAFSFASKPASHFLSACARHVTPSFPSSLTSFLRSLLSLRHLVYKCSTIWTFSLHHQHLGDSIFPILAKYVPTAPCPTLSW